MPKILKTLWIKFIHIADKLSPIVTALLQLTIRFYIAIIFWQSGLTKIDSWEPTILLFRDEYKVPLLNPELAAYIATGVELITPLMLIPGLGARFAAIALLVMTAVIQFTYISHINHLIWALLLGVIIIQGAGRFSWDFFLREKFMGPKENLSAIMVLLSFCVTCFLTIVAIHEVLTINGNTEPWITKWTKFRDITGR